MKISIFIIINVIFILLGISEQKLTNQSSVLGKDKHEVKKSIVGCSAGFRRTADGRCMAVF